MIFYTKNIQSQTASFTNVVIENSIVIAPTPFVVNVSTFSSSLSLDLTNTTSPEIVITGSGNFSISSINNYSSNAYFKIKLNNSGSGSFIPGGNIALNSNLSLTLYGSSKDWVELFYNSGSGKYYQYNVGDYS